MEHFQSTSLKSAPTRNSQEQEEKMQKGEDDFKNTCYIVYKKMLYLLVNPGIMHKSVKPSPLISLVGVYHLLPPSPNSVMWFRNLMVGIVTH